jgi:serine/threonine protein phosphatase PrpC
MNTATALHIGYKSHPGLHRTINEDRILIDETRGIFLIVDGLGGHAAGETAAEIAAHTVQEYLIHSDPERGLAERVKGAITEANNRIFELAQSHEQWTGMACVLTLAVAEDERITVGHVGDSRLYLVSNGGIQKITSDHSPVGELEQSGGITEAEAMRHPRRHEVFRDVGSERRQYDDPEFIQIRQFTFPSDAALLLCTDGLTDALTTTEIKRIINNYGGDPEETAAQLISAANMSGGKDNVSVIFVAGPEFSVGQQTPISITASDRHAITRTKVSGKRWATIAQRLSWLLAGMLLGILIWATSERLVPRATPPVRNNAAGVRSPVHITVNSADAHGISNALAGASPGDIIDIPPGDYLGPLVLKAQVSLIGSLPQRPVVRSDPASVTNGGMALVASGVKNTRVENLEVLSDSTHPLQIGIAMADSAVAIVNSKVSGAIEAGVRMEGTSEGTLFANVISGNPGTGITAKEHSLVRLSGNWITNNGKVPGALRAGLDIAPTVRIEAANNVFFSNGLGSLVALPQNERAQLQENNLFERGTRAASKLP